ncbi:MAG: aminomethyl-transferring glycine dehydrogenase subunit GcvPB [Chloroflexi bacterium]|nr:aminomethyl-transferring glycine dehydrogenase subunit GcvPB [Chloroflexota bacterium]
MTEPLIFELSSPGRSSGYVDDVDFPERPLAELLPQEMLREYLDLPELTEREVVGHFTRLSRLNYGVDTGFYPLGSCTMKYNPKVNEDMATLEGFARIHPLQPDHTVQGALQLMYELQAYLARISGLDAVSLQPAAGAHGELTGILMVRAYHRYRGDARRRIVLVPDSAHGTNPATAAMSGHQVINVKSDRRGGVDVDELRVLMSDGVAALMLTIPNTLGLFDENIVEIARIVHQGGALLYCDGANMNALLGQIRLADLGCDVMHFNLHKTFSTPHGGGGPGAGPVAVRDSLAPFLPVPLVGRRTTDEGEAYFLDYDRPLSIGRMRSFHGNFGVLVRAYTYIRSLGEGGLRHASENAVLNANYLMHLLKETYELPYDRTCMHEFVLSGRRLKASGVRTIDVAKRLLDYGYHPPITYFPLIIDEALMIEPTETETRQTLEGFAWALVEIAREAADDPDRLKTAPHATSVGRLDEVTAARRPILRWSRGGQNVD